MRDDMADYGARRTRMVNDQLVARGLRSDDVLAAMRSVPRHLFVPPDLAAEAYADSPLPIGLGQTISQPYMVALMTELLAVDVRSRVLEIGAGSGYQTAVLAEVAGEVYALELLAPLAERARALLARLGYQNTHAAIADGSAGWPEAAPFDAVLVAAAAAHAPPALLRQLRDGGRLVIPLGHPHRDQVLTVFHRVGDEFQVRRDTGCRFVPLVSGERAAGVPPIAPPGKWAGGKEVVMKAVTVRVSGIVQGVYYRASAWHEGERLGLRGWVRNESDGSVVLHVQGDPAVVDALLGWCRVGPPAARVSRVEVGDAEPDESLLGFEGEMNAVTIDDVRHDLEVQVFIDKANEKLGVLGYTEHGPRHAGIVAGIAQHVLLKLGHPQRQAELAAVAGYLHDVGNGINRLDHGIVAALFAQHVLERLGMPPEEHAEVMCAIGNHEEEYGEAVSPLAAAVILGDKSDVHRSRVRVIDPDTDDIHDRVNMATTRSFLAVDGEAHTIKLELEIDTNIIQVMQYFEIFLARMVMCRRAAEFLGCSFGLLINGSRLL